LRTFSKRPSSHDVMMRQPVALNGVILDNGRMVVTTKKH
jgi:hypothetical protein